MTVRRLGLLINPLAGLGGEVGLKGSDGAEIVADALSRGARPKAGARAAPALKALAGVAIVTAGGAIGEDACRAAGLDAAVVYRPATEPTSAQDTTAAVRAFMAEGIDLLLFAGGDGTARDIASVVGQDVPILGIPAGAKMYSGVFALSPAHAGVLAARTLAEGAPLRDAEILDIDEASLRQGRPATRLYGYARVPRDPLVQTAKAASGHVDDIGALCRAAAVDLDPAHLQIIGPGSTMLRLMAEAGLEGTLLGVDLVADGRVLARDVGEAEVLARLDGRPARIHVGIIGGTGCLFGRGNQPISADVLKRVGRDNIVVLAAPDKLASLGPSGLFVDTGDAAVDAMLSGYIRVRTAPRREMVMRVRA